MQTAMPAMTGMIINKVPWLLSLRFAGNIGSSELAAVALATTLCNVTGMSLSVGLSSAMSTLTGQARGQAKHKGQLRRKQEEAKLIGDNKALQVRDDRMDRIDMNTDCILELLPDENVTILPLVYLYRGLFIQLMFVLPVGIWWIFGIQSILLHLGQGDELSVMTERYLRILAPGLWAYSINWTFTSWLQAIEMADVPAYAAGISAILHIPFNLLFIYVFGWGYLGVGVATVVAQTIQPICIITYLVLTEHGRGRVLENTMATAMGRTKLGFWKEASVAVYSLTGILQYLSLALPGIVIHFGMVGQRGFNLSGWNSHSSSRSGSGCHDDLSVDQHSLLHVARRMWHCRIHSCWELSGSWRHSWSRRCRESQCFQRGCVEYLSQGAYSTSHRTHFFHPSSHPTKP
jgi:hypothetical protein